MRRPLLLVTLALSLAALTGLSFAARSARAQQSPRLPPNFPMRYGIALDTDRAFYAQGDSLEARVALVNSSSDVVSGWTPTVGGLGCQYTFTLEDPLGNVVWTPGTVSGGVFTPPSCVTDPHEGTLLPDTAVQRRLTIPLVYNSPTAGALNGQPLRPGPYALKAQVLFLSPAHHRAVFAEGTTPSASVGIAVE